MKLKNETSIVDHQTGEIITTSKTFRTKVTNNEEFYMTYFAFLKQILEIKSVIDYKVLVHFCMLSVFNTNQVSLPAPTRRKLSIELGVSSQQISSSILNLKKLGLISGERGLYEINPLYFWKGTNDTRNELLKNKKLVISFSLED